MKNANNNKLRMAPGRGRGNRKRSFGGDSQKRSFARRLAPSAAKLKVAKVDASSNKENRLNEAVCVELSIDESADESSDESADDEEYVAPAPNRMTREDRKENGHFFASEEELRIYVKVAYIYEFEEPAEKEWSSILTILETRLRGMHKRTIRHVFKSLQNGDAQQATKRKAGSGRKHKLTAENEGLIAAAAALNSGTSPSMALEICNVMNAPEIGVCLNTLKSSLSFYTDSDIRAIPRRKTGKKDKESAWAKARLATATQMKQQVALGKKIDAGDLLLSDAMKECRDKNAPPPLWIDGTVFADENHVEVQLGSGGNHKGSFRGTQYRYSVNPTTGALQRKKDGGVWPARKHRMVAKYPEQARACYGVAVPIQNGQEKPQMMEPWSYTGQKMVSMKVWKQKLKLEQTYRRNMKARGWDKFRGENPYLERYGKEQWEEEIAKSPRMRQLGNVRCLMDHIIAEGTKMFADSPRKDSWMLYHDHLSIWWEKQSQAHLKSLPCPIEGWESRTWWDRQIKICGDNNNLVHKRYKNCLPGDGPEFMPLDNHLFGDLQEGASKNVALTSFLHKNDERKYSFATPKKVYSALQRTIKAGVPTPKRIAEDCKRVFEETLDRVIAAEGTYIEDGTNKSSRHGVRGAAEAEFKRETIPTDSAAAECFSSMMDSMRAGGGVQFVVDLTGSEEEENANEHQELHSVPIDKERADDDDDDASDDDNDAAEDAF
jgi:hypothetical protein